MRRGLSLLCLGFLVGCGLQSAGRLKDGGDTGGGGDTSSTGGGSGGGSVGGGSPGTVWTASPVTVSPPEATWVTAISGSGSEVYALTAQTNVLRYTASGFSKVVTLDNSYGNDLYVANDGSVFPVTDASLGYCKSDCGNPLNFHTTPLEPLEDARAVCGSAPNNVYAAIDANNLFSHLHWWDGSRWSQVSADLGIQRPTSCVVLNDGTVAVIGRSKLALWKQGATTFEVAGKVPPLTAYDAASALWESIAQVEGSLFVTGDVKLVSQRTGVDQWSSAVLPATSFLPEAIGGPDLDDVFVAGRSDVSNLWVLHGGVWAKGPGLPTVVAGRAVYVAGPNEVFIGGETATMDGAIDRLTR